MHAMHLPFALEATTTVLIVIAIACVIVLALIIVAPWRQVRDEPPLDRDVETRILLRRPNPEEETGELPTARVTDLSDIDERETGDFRELRDLDDR